MFKITQNFTKISGLNKLLLFILFCFLISSCDRNFNTIKDFEINEIIKKKLTDKSKYYNHSFIAHAGGGIDNLKYTNSLNSILKSIKNGFKLIEIDLIESSDNKLVAAHDWIKFKEFINYEDKSNSPLNSKYFKNNLILNKYKTMDIDLINKIFNEYKDLILVIDKTNNFDLINKSFTFDKNRLIVEIFGRDNYFKAVKTGIINPMFSASINDYEFIIKYRIKLIAVHSKDFVSNIEKYKILKEKGVIIFVYSTNDNNFIEDNIDIASAFYTDFIDLRSYACNAKECETY